MSVAKINEKSDRGWKKGQKHEEAMNGGGKERDRERGGL